MTFLSISANFVLVAGVVVLCLRSQAKNLFSSATCLHVVKADFEASFFLLLFFCDSGRVGCQLSDVFQPLKDEVIDTLMHFLSVSCKESGSAGAKDACYFRVNKSM